MTNRSRRLQREMKIQRMLDRKVTSLGRRELVLSVFEIVKSEFGFRQGFWISQRSCHALERRDPSTINIVSMVPIEFQRQRSLAEQIFADFSRVESIRKKCILWPKTLKGAVVVPILHAEKHTVLGYFVFWDSIRTNVNEVSHLLSVVRRRVSPFFTQSKAMRSAKALSYVDDLTGLFNARYLAKVLDTEIGRSERHGGVFSVLFIDVDHLKRVNDQRGHLVGSRVLVEVSRILYKNIRNTDYGFRYGGDEFILLLVGADAEESRVVAERVRQELDQLPLKVYGSDVRVTLSIGIAVYPHHAKSKEDVIRMADEAMYAGKRSSRNVVFIAS